MNNETYFEFDDDLDNGFTTVPNYILNDIRLSYKAVGVYVQILQYRNTGKHIVYVKSLSNYRVDKKGSVTNAINELIKYGYLVKIQLRNEKGHIKGLKYIVKSKPIEFSTFQPKANFPLSDNRISEKRMSENQPLKIKYNKNKIDNKENIYTTQSVENQLVVENINLIIENTNLKVLSDNMKKKVVKWDKDRLIKTIEIFNNQDGMYFSLLEKIYKDNNNFIPKHNSNSLQGQNINSQIFKTRFHNINESFRNYDPVELEKLLLESQRGKF